MTMKNYPRTRHTRVASPDTPSPTFSPERPGPDPSDLALVDMHDPTFTDAEDAGREWEHPMYRRAIASLVGRLALSRPLAVVDLETTGVSVDRDRIVQIAIVLIMPDGDYHEFDRMVNPQMLIPPEATAVHGITDAMVADAPTFKALAPDVADWLTGCDLCGYNGKRFDRKMLESEYKRAHASCPLDGALMVDPFLVFIRQEARTLTGAMKFYCGVPDFQGHKAIDDVPATLSVLATQLDRYPDLPASVAGLHEFCEQRDPSWIDADGKLAFRTGQAVINFGRHAGRRLGDLVNTEPDYLRWILSADFTAEVKAVVGTALRGTFPAGPGRGTTPRYSATTVVPVMRSKAAIEALLLQHDGDEDPTWPDGEDGALVDVDDAALADVEDATLGDVDDAVLAEVDDAAPTDVDGACLTDVDDATLAGAEDVIWPEVQDVPSADFEDPTAPGIDPTELPQLFRPILRLIPLDGE
jgi:DNA polymerase III subunit epsilon